MRMTSINGQNVTTQFAELPGVVGRLAEARADRMRFRVWLGLVTWVLAAFCIVALVMWIDWMWVVPPWVRSLAVPAMLGVSVFLLSRYRRPYSGAEAAADAEARFPALGQRLRTVLQYAEGAAPTVPASPGLLAELGRDTDRQAAAIDFRKLIPWPVFERRAIALFLTTIVGVIALVASPSLRTAFLRMLFLPVHYTAISVEPGDLTLKAGEDLKLAVTLSGRPVSEAHWFHRKKTGGEWIAASLASEPKAGERPRPLEGVLAATLKDCQEDLEYRVAAGEVASPTFNVKVVHPLLLKTAHAKVTPPPYTRQPPVVLKEGDWNAIEGSRVELEFQLDRAPGAAELNVSSGGKLLPEKVALQIDGAKITGTLASVSRDLELELSATASDGITLEPAKRRIKVAADREPTLKIIEPEESLAVIPTTEVPIQVEARDDFGVGLLGINYKIGDGPEETLHLGRLADQPLTARALETLYLEKHAIDYPAAITYYAFAEDNFPEKPHRVVSELRFIDILPFKQEYQFLDSEGEGSCNGSSTSLEELIARQRENLNRTFALERDPAVEDAAAARLAKYEGELHAATAELAQGIAKIAGPIPALDEAVAAMQSAHDSLKAKDFARARPLEEAALRGLIAARKNMRKILKQSSSSQASACRKFDRQQAQKLRRPPAKESEQRLAALEGDIRDLARREEKFSEEIEPKGSGGPQVDPPEQQQKPSQSSSKQSSKSSSKSSTGASSNAASSSQSAPKESSLAEQQKQATQEAERLKKLAQEDEALTESARRRLEQAGNTVQDSSRAMDEARKAEAAAKAREAARQLESLARQVGALKASELSDRLARERDFAQAIARAERELGQTLERQAGAPQAAGDAKGVLAGRQRELADDAAALADVLEQLKAAARLEDRELAQTIAGAESASPPRDIENSMRQNASTIGSGQTEQAARAAAAAAGRLEALAQDLEQARRAAAGPKLERLLAAEKEAAALQDRLRSVQQKSGQAAVERALGELAERIDRLASRDGSLRQATDQLASAVRMGHGGSWSQSDQPPQGEASFFVPPTVYTTTLGAVTAALQAKIQEMIVENTLVERTGPVPPEYKKLVEDYYRVLSQDLR